MFLYSFFSWHLYCPLAAAPCSHTEMEVFENWVGWVWDKNCWWRFGPHIFVLKSLSCLLKICCYYSCTSGLIILWKKKTVSFHVRTWLLKWRSECFLAQVGAIFFFFLTICFWLLLMKFYQKKAIPVNGNFAAKKERKWELVYNPVAEPSFL